MTTARASNSLAPINFSAGPAILPGPVQEALQQALVDFEGSGLSILGLSHRSERFETLIDSAQTRLRTLLSISNDYEILFCGFGASLHFSAIPLNFLPEQGVAIYEMSGYWSDRAADEAEHFGRIWRFQAPLNATEAARQQGQIIREQMLGSEFPAYIHYCSNETIDGVAWPTLPDQWYGDVPCPLFADMSSDILSRPLQLEAHSMVYASAQKNMGISGLSVAILRKDLMGQARSQTPRLLNYEILADCHSVPNTAPVLPIYALEQTLIWIAQQGGVDAMQALARQRSDLLYSFIDASGCYINEVPQELRSNMNIPFTLRDPEWIGPFLKGAEQQGLMQLQGHRSRGGLRASLYNAMPLEGVIRLTEWMREFEQKYG
jgi:phosphoserine aminotransferase